MPKKWEYCVIAVSTDARIDRSRDSLQNDLNIMGDSGWELVAIAPRSVDLNDGLPFVAVLKRSKSSWR